MSNAEPELMHNVFTEMLEVMDTALCCYQAAVLQPVGINTQHGLMLRFKEQGVHQAIVLKLALVQSSLRATQLLLQHGHIIQQGALQRVILEADEDIQFLCCAVTCDRITELHKRYLNEFWANEFDLANPASSHQSRKMIPRGEIRAYIATIDKTMGLNDITNAKKVIYRMDSGFVHGASTHIMEIFGGSPLRFHTRGMLGTPRIPGYTRSLWNYMHRGLNSHITVAKAFNMSQVADQLRAHRKRFESLAGVDYNPANLKLSKSTKNTGTQPSDSPH